MAASMMLWLLLHIAHSDEQSMLDMDDECTGASCSLSALQVKGELLTRAGAEESYHGAEMDVESDLDHAVQAKTYSSFCKIAPEGQNCIPESRNRGKLQGYVYCSSGRQLSSGIQKVCSHGGKGSWCQQDGSGLTKGYCDDPFCRNGGAYAGNGQYCDNGQLVTCNGDNPPVVQDSCVTQQSYWDSSSNSQKWRTVACGCSGGHNNAHCNC